MLHDVFNVSIEYNVLVNYGLTNTLGDENMALLKGMTGTQRAQEIEHLAPEILARYQDDKHTVHQLVAEFGISETAMYRLLHRHGVMLHDPHSGGGRRAFTPEQDHQIALEYQQGSSAATLAKKYGVWVGTIKGAVRRDGVTLRGRGSVRKVWPQALIEQLAEEWHGGMSQKAIAEKHGLTVENVYNILRRVPALNSSKLRRREWHPHWKGGRRKHVGYVYILLEPSHPLYEMTVNGGYVLEHRLKMAEALGRPLEKHETVHHIDGNRSNNAIENLQLRQGKHGSGVVYHCADCGSRNVIASMLSEPKKD